MAARGDLTGAEVVVSRVGKRFGEHVVALRDVSFRVRAGELALLSGPSGAGKSTLLNLIAGFDRPDAGTITVAGQDVAALADAARFRREVVGFVFQLHHLIAGLTVEENVEVPLIPATPRRADRLARVRDALRQVGLGARATHVPGELSGGERQRVALARALINDPRLLLADEPTGALDSAASAHVLELLATLSRGAGTTVLLVSHEAGVERHADRILELRDGRLAAATPASSPA